MSILDQMQPMYRKELVKAASKLYKCGAEPSTGGAGRPASRAQRRQAARALGWRGSKAKRHNVERQLRLVAKAVLIDDALTAAKDRVEHPIKSRLRGV